MMKPIGFGAIALSAIFLSPQSPVFAVAPAPIDQDARVVWSEVVEDPFDGPIVYDKDFNPSNRSAYVSSWSEQAIRMTYTWYEQRIVGYQTVWRTRDVYVNGEKRQETYPEQEPIYESYEHSRSPQKILFSIDGEIYTYEEGPVSRELAAALIKAPLADLTIRLVWPNGGTDDITIGRGTVRAWRKIYQALANSPVPDPASVEEMPAVTPETEPSSTPE